MGSLWSWWALWAGATLLWGLSQEATVDPRNTGGEEFLTAFLQNSEPGYSTASLCVFISSLSENTTSVTILSQADGTSQKVTVKPGESVMVNINGNAEMTGSSTFQRAVVVHSDHRISVQALNAKPGTAELTLLWPVGALGTEYFVLTPPGISAQHVKEFAVVAGRAGASVTISLKAAVTFRNTFHAAGSIVNVTLEPYEAAQLQSTADLSGSRVTASSPVAVLSGHSCVQKHTNCNHVVEQLLPTSAWGTQYVVPPLTFQSRYDLAYVVASQTTKLTYNHGGTIGSRGLQKGDVAEFEIRPTRPLYLSADVGIQVVLFGTGAIKGQMTYDPYLVLIPDVAAYCSAYVIKSMPGTEGVALVVAQTKATSELTMDGQALGAKLTWAAVPGSEFSYAEVDLGTTDRMHTAEASSSFGLLTFGLAQAVGYGTAAACGKSQLSAAETSCQGMRCTSGQRCQMVSGKASCVAESTAVCRAQGDPHYTTFDGRRYDMMGTCSYTIAELTGEDMSLPAFSVEAKNEHRGSLLVSYVGLVTVYAYSHSVSLVRGETGFARIDNQRSRLPASLSDGQLRVYQSGTQGVIELDFGLVVTYNWDSQLTVSLPTRFQNQVWGLCGNYNGDPADDFLTPDGVQAPDALEFANSWRLDDGDYLCDDGCHNNCPTCTAGQTQHYEGDRLCGLLTLSTGPFSACHEFLDPKPFLEDCVFDLCVTGGERLSLCRSLAAYAQACAELGVPDGNWRSHAGCPLSCPANSRYDTCSPACPASCNSEAVPTNCSGRPCVEGCVCLPGFVASGGECVPESSCGCIYQGRPLAPGQEVFADDLCRQRCTCDADTQKVICKDTSGCPSGERCRVLNGLLGCYPDNFASCEASGDPHYVSFDGKRFDFMGTCAYLLVGSCGQDAALPEFKVLVENEHRGSQTVSYTRAVRVVAHGVEVAVHREYPARVMVDGILQYLPFQAADGKIEVFRQGNDAVIRTDFGLTVTYNWDARVTAKVPSSYAKAVCGLCGNFNGDPDDDLALKDGGQANSTLDFGNSWQEEIIPGCGATNPGDCSQLDSLVAEQQQSKKECGILTDSSGPFRECHKLLNPQGALRDCVYDLCLLPGQSKPLCDALAAYAAACQAAGGTVHPWRSEELCPPTCPPNSHYEQCSYGCPISCGDLKVSQGCGSECQESCVCDDGFALSGESCVPLASCGCVHQGTYYPPGETFYPGPGCDSLCHCYEGGVVSCEPSSCGSHETCQPSNGVLGCVPAGTTTCQASGDPHYVTYDGQRFDFMGTCVYVLTQTCGSLPGLDQFTVLQENAPWGNGYASATKAITVLVANHTLRLEQSQWKVQVDGVDMKLPVDLDGGKIHVSQHGSDVVIETDFGLRVLYDLMYYVQVTIPSNYYQQMCGLCGDYNGDPKDDFQKPNGSLASDPTDFGNSWEEVVPDSPCAPATPPCTGDSCGTGCSPELEDKYYGVEFCGLLTSTSGPLAACHKLIDPKGLLEDCVFDLCQSEGNLSILCNNIHAYVSACQAAGGQVEPWRTETFCPLECPPHSHYEVCADTCSLGCWALSAPPKCPEVCAEGCECDSGFLYNGKACVPVQECGCYHNGVYYEPEESVLIESCQQQCVCHSGEGMVCKNHSCNPGQVCEPSGGFLTCVTKDPCHNVTCRPQETCKDQGGQAVCVPNYNSTCWLWGDPHYHSFDGWNFDFMGTCSYLLAGTACPGVSAEGLTPFTVTTKNENRGNPAVSYVRLVTVTAYNTNITIHKNEIGKVRVNGVLMVLPVYLAGGRVSVVHGGFKAILVTDFGLQVTYDWNMRVEVTLPSSYHDAVCGLCGNMDKNPQNDQVFPNGTTASSIPTWGGSWQIPGWDPLCWNECQGSCPVCPENKLEEYEGPGYCGPLAPGAGGPFTSCHARVPPENFFKGCVLDVCMGDGIKDILCQSLAAYAAACQAAGIQIKDWRTQAGCEMTCPDNSHYELCGPPCPASCPSPARHTTPAACGGPCVEGCQCDQGFVLSAGQCVSLDSGCGCWVNGTYHEAGTEFWTDASCSERCRCEPGSESLNCTSASCGLGEECALLPSGQLGCQPASIAECQAWGDPHYITLDGHRFDFQGTCEYLLSAPCHAPPTGTEYFNVTVVNEHRGSQAVSYTRSVTLNIYGLSLTLSASWPRQLQVNGEFVALPFYLDERLSIYLSGADVVVKTAAGLSLTFDGYSFVRLHVPAAYAGTLCGLCGNYNKNPNDDLTAVDGKPEGWKVGGAPGCEDQCESEPCPETCTPKEQESFSGPNACGIISDPAGPLAPCHSLLPPSQYFEACLLDACQAEGHPGGLCPAVATYVAACQAAGAQLGEWRKPDFCPFQCPANSHYQLCGDSCPVSCPSLLAPEGCETTCREGCACDSGFVLSGDTCVPVGQCGCLYNGRYYQLGATFYPGPECERLCECGADGQVTCKEGLDCKPYEECRIENGVQACYPSGCGQCLANGGIHYVTLDGRVYDLHGSCSYVLASVCDPKPGDEEFSIVLEKNLAGEPQRVVVTVAGHVVALAHGPQVTVDDEAVVLPVTVDRVTVTAEGRNMILQTKNGLKVLFDGDAHVLMSIPSSFRGQICGLCGNFNGNWSDDFVLPNGDLAPSTEAFGEAWRAPGSSPDCGEGCGDQGCPVCLAEETKEYEKNEACGKMQDAKGPFAACHQVLSPLEYFRQCVYDMCANKGNKTYLCQSLAAYTAACQAAGATVQPWRTEDFCPLQCPAHSHYSVCTSSCKGSCAALAGLTQCSSRCFEGCECDDHFLLSQGVCVPAQQCGCTYDGHYMPVNSSLLTSDCSQLCCCSGSTGLSCHPTSCPSGQVCKLQDGVRSCQPAQGVCSITVGANLTTFDGAHNAISSPGVYEVSSLCPGIQKPVPWYRVVADVQSCDGNDKIVDKVHIFFQDGLVTVTRSNGVWVNGLRVDLPASVLTSVSVKRLPDGSMLIHQEGGVQVRLGIDGHLDVMVGDDHEGILCGACGNFDGDQANDKFGSQENTSMEKWEAQDFSPCSS